MSRWQLARVAAWLRLAIGIDLVARALERLAHRVYRRARQARGAVR
jgi:hypothetical protein